MVAMVAALEAVEIQGFVASLVLVLTQEFDFDLLKTNWDLSDVWTVKLLLDSLSVRLCLQ